MAPLLHKTDSQLKSDVLDELAWAADVDSTHVGVAVTGGAVTLSGEAGSFPEKHAATRAALRVHGVTAVADEITVRSPSSVNDTDLAREAGEALERAVDVPAEAVKATVHEHVVTLSGEVAWQYQREAAYRAVHYLRGVKNVVSLVTIRPKVSPSDIKASITAALVRGAQSDGRHAEVTHDGRGVVTLAGVVHSRSEREAAARAAWSAPGVSEVVNHMRISG